MAKQVRTETGITRGAVSVGSVAVELAEKIFGDLAGCRVLLLGAGKAGARVARSLQSRGVSRLVLSNRTFERAAELARELGGMALHFDQWQSALPDVDIVISSTAPRSNTRQPARSPKIFSASSTATEPTETAPRVIPVSVRTCLATRNACWKSRLSAAPVAPFSKAVA
ncbi:MAG: NAD(P)-binding domain-containing protein [Chthoniobacterales bacterium]